MAVANALDFQKEREVMKGAHQFDHGTYVPTPNFEPSTYPKWLYKVTTKGTKKHLAANQEEELVMIEAGFSDEAPKEKLATDED